VIVTLAGHVDHGKTSLVRALTGVDTDRLEEEKRRGLTIDLGFAYADFDGKRVGFVDVPGHQRFIHNMVAGVAARQVALLVIAADDGVMPQTREHLTILELIGVQRAIVAITKTDRVDADRMHDVIENANELVDASTIERIATIPTSSTTGAGIDALRDRVAALAMAAETATQDECFRLAVDRVFTVRGAGLVATGTVHSGQVRSGDDVTVAPRGVAARVRGLRVKDRDASQALPGDRCALNLTGISADRIERGDWIVAPDALAPSQRIVVDLRVVMDRVRPVRHWLPVHAYHATSHSEAHVALLDSPPIGAGETALVELVLEVPFNAKHGDAIVLRDHGLDATTGGGKVIDIWTVTRRRRRPERLAALHAQQTDDPWHALAELLTRGILDVETFRANWNVTRDAMQRRFDARTMVRIEQTGREFWQSADHWRAWLDDLVRCIGGYHKTAPHSPGLKRDQLRQVSSVPAEWLDATLASLVKHGRITESSGQFALPGHRPRLPEADERLYQRVERALRETEQPPSIGDLAKRLRVDLGTLKAFVQRMHGQGLLVRVSDNRALTPEFVARMARQAMALHERQAAGFSAKEFRDATGIGRNLVIDILEWSAPCRG